MFNFIKYIKKLNHFIKNIFLAKIITLFCLLFAFSAFAQNSNPLPIDKAFQLSLSRLENNKIKFEWKIADGYYLYQDKMSITQNENEILFSLDESAISKNDPYFGVLNVYYNQVSAEISVPSDLLTPVEVHYQGCQENGICYAATVKQISPVSLAVINEKQAFDSPFSQITSNNTSLSSNWSVPSNEQNSSEQNINTINETNAKNFSVAENTSSTGITIASDNGGMVDKLQRQGGVILVLASFVLFGVLLAFTPCVFPMYPILAGAIAREGDNVTAKRGFSLSVVYVVAMASAFGLLGIAAAWSGQNLQMALQSPIAIILVSALFSFLALSMFGLFEIQLPSSWVNFFNRMGNGKRGSYTSAGVLGFTSALIVGPCVTAPLAGALLYIAQTGDVVLGALALFALGIGKGLPLIIFGTIGPKALPKAGGWMNAVRQVFGFFFIAAAIYMLSRILPLFIIMVLWAVLALVVAIWLIAFNAFSAKSVLIRYGSKAIGVAFVLYAISLGVGLATGSYDPLTPLAKLIVNNNNSNELLNDFKKVATIKDLKNQVADNGDKQTLVYVTADWCISCTVIEKTVLNDKNLLKSLQPFNLIKFDVTKNTQEQQEVMQQLQVYGPPTMLFLSNQGVELVDTRLIGDITKSSLAQTIQKVETNI